MIITKVSVSRKFFLGNYETCDVSVEAELGEKDSAPEIWSVLKDTAENWFMEQQRKKTQPSPNPAPNVEKQGSKPSVTSPSVASAPLPSPSPTPNHRTTETVRQNFPEELEARLNFEEKGEYIIIKPKQFLGDENFAKIASTVRGLGGTYISAGKESHFRVPVRRT